MSCRSRYTTGSLEFTWGKMPVTISGITLTGRRKTQRLAQKKVNDLTNYYLPLDPHLHYLAELHSLQ